jgi:pimeloyl-ACP methyl ester carboxylesterase
MPMLALDDVNLYYEEHGGGVPLVLVAGLASDSQSWQPVVPALCEHCRVIVLDNRGTGRTTPLDTRTSIAAMADDCIALVDHLQLKSVNVVGHSMGGFIAMECAIRHPARIAKLVLAAAAPASSARNNDLFTDWADALDAGANPASWFRNLFYWLFSPAFFDDPNAVAAAVRFAIDYPYPQPPRAFRNQVNAIAEFDRTLDLAQVRAPTRVIAAAEDLLSPVTSCERLAQSIPTADLVLIERAGHALHVEQPSAFARHVLDFLSG